MGFSSLMGLWLALIVKGEETVNNIFKQILTKMNIK